MAQSASRAAARARPAKDRSTLYEEITNKIIAELEAGRLPWVQPWGSSSVRAPLGMPKNAATGRAYSGINVLILWDAVVEHGFSTQSWLTFKQVLALGGHVRKGERGTTVVYADRFIPDDVRDRAHERGEEPRAIPFLKRFTVFNVEQCDGLPDGIAAVPPPVDTSLILPQVEELIRATGADIRIGGDKAYYDVDGDFIRVPPPQAFFEPINWHRTAVHELSHWSGAPNRLARDLSGSFGSKPYIHEELCGEISAAFVCAALGVVPTVRHADYVGAWLEVLRENNGAIVRAASAASKASDYLLAFRERPVAAGRQRREERSVTSGRTGCTLFRGWRRCEHAEEEEGRVFRDGLKEAGMVLSQSNVRRIKAGVAIEELAEDIARRTLLQSLTVRPILDDSGAETGMFEVPAGGRRYRALELLVKQKRLSRTAPIPCVVRTGGIAEEDSLAENVQRAPLHPLDQFRAFLALREKGQSEEEIAAAFFVSPNVVRQRLRLAAVSPKLLDVYADEGMSLEQLMAFTVNPDHARQEHVWEALQRSYTREAYQIRRLLTEHAVRTSDKRAQFVGIEAYQAAGGIVLRDLFESDDGGWLQSPALLDRLVTEKLEREAETVRAEGWKWVEVAPDFPYGHTYGLRRLSGAEVPLTEEETASREALEAELDKLEETYAEAEELPEEVDRRLAEIETALAALNERPVLCDPAEVARAGAFVSIDSADILRMERGYIRPEDEAPIAAPDDEGAGHATANGTAATATASVDATTTSPATTPADPAGDGDEDDDESVRPLSDRLMTELTAHRTLALREAIANDPDTAFLAILHALCLKLFYRFGLDTCLEVEVKSVLLGTQVAGLGDMAYAQAIDARHGAWAAQLPKEPGALWDMLVGLDGDSRQALFAHCVGLTVNATYQPYDRRPKGLADAGRLVQSVHLDMAAAGWRPTVASYLGRVTKARILEAVREAKGEAAAQLIGDLKKAEMAREAERLLEGTGWLPEPLRLANRDLSTRAADFEALPAFLAENADGEPHAVAAE